MRCFQHSGDDPPLPSNGEGFFLWDISVPTSPVLVSLTEGVIVMKFRKYLVASIMKIGYESSASPEIQELVDKLVYLLNCYDAGE